MGSSPSCDITLDSPFLNPEHLKLIYVTRPYQARESTPSFPVQPVPRNYLYVRDVARSGRVRELPGDHNKMVVLKRGMVIGGVGLVEGLYEVRIDSLPEASEEEVRTLENTLNADRVSYI